MSCFDSIHKALHNSTVGKAVQQVKQHPAKSAAEAKFALALA